MLSPFFFFVDFCGRGTKERESEREREGGKRYDISRVEISSRNLSPEAGVLYKSNRSSWGRVMGSPGVFA